jgi:glucosamine-6-phosphate deaminase
MEVIIQATAQAASDLAARIVVALVRRKPNAVLGLATGSSQIPLYRSLVEQYREGALDLCGVTTFNLDEYVGLSPDHPASYHRFMREYFFDHVNVPEDRIHIPDGMAADIPRHCEAYEAAIEAAGGIDLQLLGTGTEGHIGFNEPSSSLASRTRIKTLTEATRRSNAATFGGYDDVPRHVITMGIGSIMASRECLLLAFGDAKARAIAAAVEGPLSAAVPASILQLHPVARVVVDEAAAAKLERADYYRSVYEGKPDWQA